MRSTTMDCTTVAELLPWYLNGSLEPKEAAALDAHLATCPVCQLEHRETAFSAAAFAIHPATEDLVDLAFRRPLESSRRQLLDAHLKACAACREELELIEKSRDTLALLEAEVTDTPPRRISQAVPIPIHRSGAHRLRSLALAASVLFAVAAGLLLWNWQPQGGNSPVAPGQGQATAGLGSSGSQSGSGALPPGSLNPGTELQLLAVRPATMDPTGGPQQAPLVHLSPEEPSLFLTVHQPQLGTFQHWHGAIFTAEGHRLWQAESLASVNGRLEAMVPVELLLPGPLELHLWNPATGSSATGATLTFELALE